MSQGDNPDDKKRNPALTLLKLTAWVGAGFAASRALRRPSPAGSAAATGSPAPSRAGDVRAQGPQAPAVAEPDPTAVEEPAETPGRTESMWVPGVAGSLHLLRRAPIGRSLGRLPILFVHGLGGSAEQWRDVLAHLPGSIDCVALDLPGHGRSDVGGESDALSIADLSTAVGAVADGLDWRRFLIVGHSLGAAVAVHYAGSRPRRTAGLLLVDPNGDQSRIPESDRRTFLDAVQDQAHEELRWQYQDLLAGSSEETRQKVVEDLEATQPEVLLQTLAAAFDYSPLEDLDTYTGAQQGPIRCLLSPMNDLPYSLHRLRPDLQVAIVRGSGHWIMLDEPDALLELLHAFFEAAQPPVH